MSQQPAQSAPAPATATTSGGAGGGLLNNDDVAHWKKQFNEVLAKPSETINSKSPEGSQPWYHSIFNCFAPIETCFLSCCCPCVVFGRTHHRLHRDSELKGWEPVNTSCLLMYASSFVCLHWAVVAMQRAEIRAKHNLQGDCLTDIALTCCCGCCTIAQNDKEAEYRAKLLSSGQQQQGYQAPAGMTYPAGEPPKTQ